MTFDAGTVFFLLIATCLLVSLMLFVAWMQNRQRAYLWWSAGFLLLALGLVLTSARVGLPDIAATGGGSVLLLAGLGLCWAGARSFDSRPIHAWPLAIGVLAWAAIYMIPEVNSSPAARSAILSVLIAAYSFAIAYEFWIGRTEALASRLPLVVLCVINGALHLGRIMLSPFESGDSAFAGDIWFAASMIQPALIMVAGGLYGIGLARDRTEHQLREFASIDSLTRALNRGAFLDEAERRLAAAAPLERSVALLLFDLDRFKEINDSQGHGVGDQVLAGFAASARDTLRASDLFGRIGGEEFAALLIDLDEPGARAVAERLRRAFAASSIQRQMQGTPATVSVGVVAVRAHAVTLDGLLAAADRALYEAKRSGRDQVRSALALAS